jgi:hypothetical protein
LTNLMEITMTDVPSQFTFTHEAEIIFPPALFEKRLASPRAKEPRWEMALAIAPDHPDLKALKHMVVEFANSKRPGITSSPTAWKYPWSSADAYLAKSAAKEKKYDNTHLIGKVLINTHSTKYEPKLSVLMPGRGVVDFWEQAARQTVKDKFYAGALVLADVTFYWYDESNGLPGVALMLNKVLSLNKGERRGGGKSGSETFGAHVGHLSAVDPTAAQIDY